MSEAREIQEKIMEIYFTTSKMLRYIPDDKLKEWRPLEAILDAGRLAMNMQLDMERKQAEIERLKLYLPEKKN